MMWGGSLVIMTDRDRGRQDEAGRMLRVIWIRIMWWPAPAPANDGPWPITNKTRWQVTITRDWPQQPATAITDQHPWPPANNRQGKHCTGTLVSETQNILAKAQWPVEAWHQNKLRQQKYWCYSNCGNILPGAVVWKHWVLKLGPNNSV